MKLKELTPCEADLELLRQFYDGLYSREFPDPDERESYANMATYLRGDRPRDNAYHILLGLDANEVVGGSITDYFARSNSGVIEFLVIAESRRGKGLGSLLLQATEDLLVADAGRVGQKLERVLAEINDPFRHGRLPDNMDPFARAHWWGRRGYRRLEFPYVQPALSADQRAVEHLLLCTKELRVDNEWSVPAAAIDAFIRDYLMFAMRFAKPESSAEYRVMHAWLSTRNSVPVHTLSTYIDGERLYR